MSTTNPVVLQLQACFASAPKARGSNGVGNINMISSPQLLQRRSVFMVDPSRNLKNPTPLVLLKTRRRLTMAAAPNSNGGVMDMVNKMFPFSPSSASYGDPCLDFFFNVKNPSPCYSFSCYEDEDEDDDDDDDDRVQNLQTLEYMCNLLPVAWSHNPLTTLKIICRLASCSDGNRYAAAFRKASVWLHQNHPQTLLRNLDSIADSFGYLFHIVQIPYDILKADHSDFTERYARDPNYKLLYDRVVEVVVERLKYDIEKIKENKLGVRPSVFTEEESDSDDSDDSDDDPEFDSDDDVDESLKFDFYGLRKNLLVTQAGTMCIYSNPKNPEENVIATLFLREAIARTLFPQESHRLQEWERFMKEFLVPLNKYFNRQYDFALRFLVPGKSKWKSRSTLQKFGGERETDPHKLMEAAIAGKHYQALVVVD